eukprot:scaffold9632_cov36-Phaeocystis_antarctica.AAC.2
MSSFCWFVFHVPLCGGCFIHLLDPPPVELPVVRRPALAFSAGFARWLAPIQLGCRIGRMAERLPII